MKRLLSTRMLIGEPVLGYQPAVPPQWPDGRPDANQLRAILRRAALQGIAGLLTVNDLRVLEAQRAVGAALPLVPVVPNVTGYVRDAVDYGLVGAGLRRLRQLSLPGLVRVGLVGLAQAGAVLRKDFSAILRVLFEVEMSAFRRYDARRVLLSPQVTDLAVAFDHGDLVRLFVDRMQTRYRKEPGLATNNPLALLDRLDAWGVAPPPLLAPVNRRGYLMQPDPARWEAAVRDRPLAVTADVIGIGAPPGEDDIDYLASLGIDECVVDVDALRD